MRRFPYFFLQQPNHAHTSRNLSVSLSGLLFLLQLKLFKNELISRLSGQFLGGRHLNVGAPVKINDQSLKKVRPVVVARAETGEAAFNTRFNAFQPNFNIEREIPFVHQKFTGIQPPPSE